MSSDWGESHRANTLVLQESCSGTRCCCWFVGVTVTGWPHNLPRQRFYTRVHGPWQGVCRSTETERKMGGWRGGFSGGRVCTALGTSSKGPGLKQGGEQCPRRREQRTRAAGHRAPLSLNTGPYTSCRRSGAPFQLPSGDCAKSMSHHCGD